MTRGRKPKAASLKVLHGDFSKKAKGRDERGVETACRIPDKPVWLESDGVASVEWDRITQEMHSLGIIAAVDRAALENYCLTYSNWRNAELKCRIDGRYMDNGRGGVSLSSAAKEAADMSDRLNRLMAEIGMTPSSRNRMHQHVEPKTQPMRRDRTA